MPELAVLVRFTVALVLLVAAAGKVRNPGAFVDAVRKYELLPDRTASATAYVVIAAEASLGVALLLGVAARAALIGATALLLVFAAASGSALVRRKRLECGCLGSTGRLRVGWTSIAGNLVLAAGALASSTQPAVEPAFPAETAQLAIEDTAVLWALAMLLAGTYWLVLYAESVAVRLSERYETGDLT